eukprot:scaffold21.g2101.t1
MTPPRILVLGEPGVGKHSLAGRVMGGGPLDKGRASHPWTLDTKYYTAEVAVEIRRLGPEYSAAMAAGYEAVVLVFDAGRPASFDTLRVWWEASGDGDVAVKLAVAAKADCLGAAAGTSSSRPAWLEEAVAWCGKQFIEYVESSAQEAAAPAPGRLPLGEEGGEPGGTARVLEALQANMWPGLCMKERGRGGAGDSGPAPDAPVAAAGPAPAVALEAGRREQYPGVVAEQEGFDFGEYLLRSELEGASGTDGSGGGGGGTVEMEQEMQQMEQLLSQIESTRDQLQQLPDAERRQTAAAMVMQLMGALGFEEEDSEDATSSSSSDEEESATEPAAANGIAH